MDSPPPIWEAWSEAVPVDVDDKSSKPTYRWHPPTYILFVGRGKVVKTAIDYSNTLSFKTDHLKYCNKCRSHYDPSRSEQCHWCNDEQKHPKME